MILIHDLEILNHCVISARETIWLLLEAHVIPMYGNDIQNTGEMCDKAALWRGL